MNVLMINGSPKPNGNTAIALHEMEQIFVVGGGEPAGAGSPPPTTS